MKGEDMGALFGFRVALSLLYVVTILLMALLGGVMGYGAGIYLYSDAPGGFIAGGFVGAIVGWVMASFVTGIGHTLLAINDHLAAIRKKVENTQPAEAVKELPPPVKERIVPTMSARKSDTGP